MKKVFIYFILLAPLNLFFLACTQKASMRTKTEFTQVNMGNPLSLIQNTVQEPTFNDSIFDLSSEFKMTANAMFSSQVEVKKHEEDVGNGTFSATGGFFDITEKTNDLIIFRSRRVNPKQIELVNIKKSIKLIFSKTSEKTWILSDLEYKKVRYSSLYKFKPVHVSVSNDQANISFLNSFSSRKNRKDHGLIAFYFQIGDAPLKTEEEISLNKTSPYVYLRPYAPKWSNKKTVELQICSPMSDNIRDEITISLQRWYQVLIGRLDLNINYEPKAIKPFSDLNTHCIYFVDDFLLTTSSKTRAMGYTMMTFNQKTNEIIDGDILILKKEFAKANLPFDHDYHSKQRYNTFIHELGHWLGLDHQFNGTESIMSYSKKVSPRLYEYDIQAIQNLYPPQVP